MPENRIIEEFDTRVGFGPRLGAYTIDVIINLIFGGLLGMIFGAIIFGSQMNALYDNGNTYLNWAGIFGGFLGTFFGLFLGIIYLTIILGIVEGLTGWSIGKGILRMRIRHKSGQDANMFLLFFRFALKFAPCFFWAIYFTGLVTNQLNEEYAIIAVLLSIITFFAILFVFGKSKQTLFDLVSQTAVFKKENR